MPIKIIRQDITKIKCDAIVNPTDPLFSHGGGVDAAIHEAAGEGLYAACRGFGELGVGETVLTAGFLLPCKYVIHTVGPIWSGGEYGEEKQLRSCYRRSLERAKEKKLKSIAFPLISSGTFGFPKDKVLKIAMDEISTFLLDNELQVFVVVFDKTAYSISEKLYSDITSFIDDNYSEWNAPLFDSIREEKNFRSYSEGKRSRGNRLVCDAVSEMKPLPAPSLEELMAKMDKGFADTLLYYIDKKGMTDVECYKKANVDKKTFSKLKCNKDYKPSKVTAVSFAIALRLDIRETEHLLRTVGMSLSRSSKFDVIIEYFITTGNYKNIHDVNETLHQFDQNTLGC